jgi:hypothetical protein
MDLSGTYMWKWTIWLSYIYPQPAGWTTSILKLKVRAKYSAYRLWFAAVIGFEDADWPTRDCNWLLVVVDAMEDSDERLWPAASSVWETDSAFWAMLQPMNLNSVCKLIVKSWKQANQFAENGNEPMSSSRN